MQSTEIEGLVEGVGILRKNNLPLLLFSSLFLFILLASLFTNQTSLSTISLQMFFLTFSLSFVDIEQVLRKDVKKAIFLGVFSFIVVVAISFIVSFLLYYVLSIHDQQIIVEKISALPWYILLFGIFFAPISEEMFFRALLTSRFGILLPNILFALSHAFYGSIVEIVSVFLIGVYLSFVFVRSRNILVPIIAHMLYNILSLFLIWWLF